MFYNYGKNYFMSIDNYNFTTYTTENILDFLRGYIELHSKLILPNNIINYNKNINNLYDKYPLLNLYIRKKEDIDNILLDRIIKLLSKELYIEYSIEFKNKSYNKIKYNVIIKFENYHVLNFLSKIYPPNIDKNDIDEYLYSLYLTLSNYRYINYDTENDTMQYYIPKCKIELIHPGAIKPNKEYASDIGYSINIIQRTKQISDKIFIYDTGLKITPQYGYFYELLPTTQLAIHGYLLGTQYNDFNQKNNNTLLITLIKIDNELPDIKLPYNCCIMLLKEMKHYELIF